MNAVKEGNSFMKGNGKFLSLIFVITAIAVVTSALGITAFAFSDEYEPYYPQITAVTRSVDEIYARISGSTVQLPEETVKARKEMIQMYKDAGIDVSLDMENWLGSYRMTADFPQRYSKETPIPLGSSPDYSGAFSVDACWNNKIPADAPKVFLPRSALSFKIHIGVVKANIDDGGWGTGLPQIVSTSADPYYTIASKYTTGNINKAFKLRAKKGLFDYVNNAQTGDEHIIFVDSETDTAVQVWKGRAPGDPRGYGLSSNLIPNFDVRASASSIEYSMGGIGEEGQCGVNAANCVTNAYTIKSSEISSTTEMINHAVGGAIGQMVTARVFPAISIDAYMAMYGENEGARSENNVGAVPYGGVIQLDPELDVKALYDAGKLSFHAYRMLKAMQEYGFYNIDHSGGSFFFYTNTYSNDWKNPDFRGFDVPYKNNAQGFEHVVDELDAFFKGNEFFGLEGEPKVYVTIPVVKYANLEVNGDGAIDQTDYDLVGQNMGQAYSDATKVYDVNQDKEITPADIEIMYNYLNDMPMHTFTWYDASYADNDETHGRILGSGTSTTIDGVKKYREGALVSFAAIPNNGYEFAGWTGDFAGQTSNVVKVKMDKDYTFGAKYKKTEDKDFVVKVLGPGHVEVSETAITYDAPLEKYGKNTLMSIKAVPDEGYAFLGWAGDITGYANPANYLVDKDTEIVAIFGEVGYTEEFINDEWALKSGAETAYKITEGQNIKFSDFSQANMTVVNANKDKIIDMSGDFTLRATMSHTTSIIDSNKAKIVFNYKDDKNHYYLYLGGAGKVELGKVFKGVNTVLKSHSGSLDVNGVGFNKFPITLEIQKSGAYITVTGYKDGEKLEYMKVRDKSLKGGTYGFGTQHDGILTVSGVVLTTATNDITKAKKQVWSKTGNTDPWLSRLRGAVAVSAESDKSYVKDDYSTIGGGIKPYYGADGETVYVPVRYVVENLGGKISYDPATDSVIASYGEYSVSLKAWTNGAQEVNGTLYVPAKILAEGLGKQFYQYKSVVFFSDTMNIYDPGSEPECIEFIKKTFDIQYYM